MTPVPAQRLSRLDAITTHWSRVDDPSYFVLRYELAVRKYLASLLKNPDEVNDVIHEVLVGILKRGLGQIKDNAGRFRDYLRTSLRHAVFQYCARRPRRLVPRRCPRM
ncbi:MAG: sigma factor [Gemmatales bacterium]